DRLRAPLRLAAAPAVRPQGRPALLAGLRHDDGRVVVAIARRVAGERRWRSLCVLVDAGGALSDVLYRDAGTLAELRDSVIEPIAADGYARVALTPSSARRLVAAAARRAVAAGRALPSGYYLGRDLLELADSHVTERSVDAAAVLGRALDLLAAGDGARARPLLEHVVARRPDDAEAISAFGLCLLGLGELDGAVRTLARAAELEPAWPLHHWNLAAAAHRAGRLEICAHALAAFLVHAGEPGAAAVDAGHERRVSIARRFLADHRRFAAITQPESRL
ncbi:MAG TPA: tetratricopeptide repeat protein, partial [Kofleriaceae bacterium]|nr:tetratricopeptide repeat protein [Kofleriaceae bacterium]